MRLEDDTNTRLSMRWPLCALPIALLCVLLVSSGVASDAWAQEASTPSRKSLDNRARSLCIEQPLSSVCQVVKVDALLVVGAVRTRREVITRELLFEEGAYASISQIEESIQRLRNLGIFREVTYELLSKKVPLPDGTMPAELSSKRPSRLLKITVDERWTLLPFGSFAQGGGLTSTSLGFFDVNLFGRYLEAGIQYSRLGQSDTFWKREGAANSFMLWFSQPRFLNTYTRVGFDVRRALRQRRIYDEETGEKEGGFTLQRDLAVLRLNREFLRWFRAGATVELIHDAFSSRFLDDETIALQLANFGDVPERARVYMLRWHASLGRVNSDDFYVDGWSVASSVGHSDELWMSTQTFTDIDFLASYYKRLPWRGNLAMRAHLGMTNTDLIQFYNYIGGLNRVRGYRDSRFRGRGAWSVNAEYRIAPVATRWVVLQGVGFVDVGATADRALAFDRVDALSVGGGIRLISPKIYGLIMRADYAFPLTPGESSRLSFGGGQFF